MDDGLKSLKEAATEDLEKIVKALSEFKGSRIDERVSLRYACEEEIERRKGKAR